MENLVDKAKRFATQGHRRIDEAHKDIGKPYDAHLKAVAALVGTVSDNQETLAAAWLHDIVEDTPATLDEIERNFGGTVAALVHELMDVSRPESGGPGTRRTIRLRHFAKASPAAKTVKLADIIDTCQSLCKRAPNSVPAWLTETAPLIEVLGEGDAALLKRARTLLEQCARRFGAETAVRDETGPIHGRAHSPRQKHARTLRVFTRMFTANEIAEPLRSFDDLRPLADAAAAMVSQGVGVAGVRRDGVVTGYLRADPPGKGTCGAACSAFRSGQVVSGNAPLADVIEVLTRHDFCFVSLLGEVAGVIQRSDMLKPVVRMWLFGMLTLMEQEFTDRVRELWPGGGWQGLLPPSRLQLAEQLREERVRRGQPCSLLDCLQLSDKGQILLTVPAHLAAFGFKTRSAAQRVLGDVESLRNNLAHSQDIVAHDWPQIIRIARRIENAAGTFSGPDSAENQV